MGTQLSIDMRPRSFDEVIGQAKVVEALKKTIKKDNIPRAVMFYGPTGTGKTTLARIYAREIQGADFPKDQPLDPLDVLEVNAAAFNDKNFMDRLAELAITYPLMGKYRVIILDEAQQVTENGQNSLLPSFEKEAEGVLWIICTTHPAKIIPPLRGRCVSFELKGLTSQERDILITRAAKEYGYKGDNLTTFANEISRCGVTGARDILQACQKFFEDMSPAEAVRTQMLQPVQDDTDEQAVEQELPLPEFPKLTGPLRDLVEAITTDIPREHKALCVLTYFGLALSGRIRLASPYDHLQPRFYACLIGPPGTGKSAAAQEIGHPLQEQMLGDVHVEFSIDSGAALFETLEEHPRLLYIPDEQTDAFQKARVGRSLGQWLRLYESNEIGRRVVKRKGESTTTKLTDVHFAMVATATPESFQDMWQGTRGGSGGLQSRVVLSFSKTPMPLVRTANDYLGLIGACDDLKNVLTNILSAAPLEISLPEKVGSFTAGLVGDELHIDRQRFSRVVDMGRRFALILAACNGKTQIDEETMKLSAAFINYQLAAYKRFMPDDASSPVESFVNRLIAYFEKHPRSTRLQAANYLKPQKSRGGLPAFNKAFDSLIHADKLKWIEKNHKGNDVWELVH